MPKAARSLDEQTDRTLSHAELNKLHNCLLTATVPVEAERSEEGTKVRMQYGPHWNNMRRFFRNENEAVAELSLPEDLARDSADYGVHPALMDRATSLLNEQTEDRRAYLPLRIRTSRFSGRFLLISAPLCKKGNKVRKLGRIPAALPIWKAVYSWRLKNMS